VIRIARSSLLPLLALSAALVVGLVSACGGGSDNSDPRVGEVGGVAELATYAYAAAGADGLYDYLAPSVTERCSREGLATALHDAELPTGWRQIKDVGFEGDKATATVIFTTPSGDREVKWTFQQGSQGWRLLDLPGLEKCSS
jgi:hypothetical protein